MFDSKNRYITKGVEENVPLYLIMLMWELIDRENANTALDCLQIFRLSAEGNRQKVIHEQEQPKKFRKTYDLSATELFTGKVYVIDDGDHETMLLAEEY
jgi:hypothetical protein